MFNKISIIGVGLIGGSIGLAARKRRLSAKVIGIGRRKVSIDRAIRKGAVDRGTLNLRRGVEDADLIVVATPVEKVKLKIREAAGYAKNKAVIIDVNSTKQDVADSVRKYIRNDISFVGTHPMAGSEQAGIASSDAELFNDSVCIITPVSGTDKDALKKVKGFWSALGAVVTLMSPKAHDDIIADISHLPHILAYVLCHAFPPKELKMAGAGFKDVTRIARSNPKMWQEIFMQNRKSLLRSIMAFEKDLAIFKDDIIKKRSMPLTRKLAAAKRKRDVLG